MVLLLLNPFESHLGAYFCIFAFECFTGPTSESEVVIRVEILTKFCIFNVAGRPFKGPKIFYAHFVGLEQTTD